jgi:ubiquitin carboxyl-terminal hydrolase 36/42
MEREGTSVPSLSTKTSIVCCVLLFESSLNISHWDIDIAKHLRRGRQEDAHEFLRYLIDACQKTCLDPLSPKERLNHALAETSWVHKIFGGKTRSRVKCRRCGHGSDTFEACLDLSLDLRGCTTVDQALQAFVREEDLGGEGKDRYKCEK